VDGLGNSLSGFDDPNMPSLLGAPLLGYRHYDAGIYADTRAAILDPAANKLYFRGGRCRLLVIVSTTAWLGNAFCREFLASAYHSMALERLFRLPQELGVCFCCKLTAPLRVSTPTKVGSLLLS